MCIWSSGKIWTSQGPTVETGTDSIYVEASSAKNSGLGAPTDIEFPFTIAKQFTIDNDYIKIKYKKPSNWAPGSNIIFDLNWTKSQDTDQSGNKVKWQVEYLFADVDYDISEATPDDTLTSEQTYIDSGTTTHIAYQTGDLLEIIPANVQEDKNYLYAKIGAITPSSSELSEPVLLTINLCYTGFLPVINY